MARRTRVAQRSILEVLETSTRTGACAVPGQTGTDDRTSTAATIDLMRPR
jgi:hypothetical protein